MKVVQESELNSVVMAQTKQAINVIGSGNVLRDIDMVSQLTVTQFVSGDAKLDVQLVQELTSQVTNSMEEQQIALLGGLNTSKHSTKNYVQNSIAASVSSQAIQNCFMDLRTDKTILVIGNNNIIENIQMGDIRNAYADCLQKQSTSAQVISQLRSLFDNSDIKTQTGPFDTFFDTIKSVSANMSWTVIAIVGGGVLMFGLLIFMLFSGGGGDSAGSMLASQAMDMYGKKQGITGRGEAEVTGDRYFWGKGSPYDIHATIKKFGLWKAEADRLYKIAQEGSVALYKKALADRHNGVKTEMSQYLDTTLGGPIHCSTEYYNSLLEMDKIVDKLFENLSKNKGDLEASLSEAGLAPGPAEENPDGPEETVSRKRAILDLTEYYWTALSGLKEVIKERVDKIIEYSQKANEGVEITTYETALNGGSIDKPRGLATIYSREKDDIYEILTNAPRWQERVQQLKDSFRPGSEDPIACKKEKRANQYAEMVEYLDKALGRPLEFTEVYHNALLAQDARANDMFAALRKYLENIRATHQQKHKKFGEDRRKFRFDTLSSVADQYHEDMNIEHQTFEVIQHYWTYLSFLKKIIKERVELILEHKRTTGGVYEKNLHKVIDVYRYWKLELQKREAYDEARFNGSEILLDESLKAGNEVKRATEHLDRTVGPLAFTSEYYQALLIEYSKSAWLITKLNIEDQENRNKYIKIRDKVKVTWGFFPSNRPFRDYTEEEQLELRKCKSQNKVIKYYASCVGHLREIIRDRVKQIHEHNLREGTELNTIHDLDLSGEIKKIKGSDLSICYVKEYADIYKILTDFSWWRGRLNKQVKHARDPNFDYVVLKRDLPKLRAEKQAKQYAEMVEYLDKAVGGPLAFTDEYYSALQAQDARVDKMFEELNKQSDRIKRYYKADAAMPESAYKLTQARNLEKLEELNIHYEVVHHYRSHLTFLRQIIRERIEKILEHRRETAAAAPSAAAVSVTGQGEDGVDPEELEELEAEGAAESADGVFRMGVQEPWFTEVVSGRKTVEGRAGPAGKFDHLVGKVVEIVQSGNRDATPVQARVTAVRHYKTLPEYIKGEGWKKIAPQAGSDAGAAKAYADVEMTRRGKSIKVFDQARVAGRGGLNAVELALVK